MSTIETQMRKTPKGWLRCYLSGCFGACLRGHFLFCRAHWIMVPIDLQLDIDATARQRGKIIGPSWAPWLRAHAKGEAAVLRKLYPVAEEQIANRLAKVHAFANELETSLFR